MRLFASGSLICISSKIITRGCKDLLRKPICIPCPSSKCHKIWSCGVLGSVLLGVAIAPSVAKSSLQVSPSHDLAPELPRKRNSIGHNILSVNTQKEYLRPAIICPTDHADLMPLLLRDLPSYANRVSTRAQVLERSFNPRGVVIAAAQAAADETWNMELPIHSLFSPNPASPDEAFLSAFSLEQDIDAHNLVPLFFTTLERQYLDDHVVRLQHYHWAFLSQSDDPKAPQWHLALMFSRLGDYPADHPVTPPRESRQGSIGQALQLWLRDCNAGSVSGTG